MIGLKIVFKLRLSLLSSLTYKVFSKETGNLFLDTHVIVYHSQKILQCSDNQYVFFKFSFSLKIPRYSIHHIIFFGKKCKECNLILLFAIVQLFYKITTRLPRSDEHWEIYNWKFITFFFNRRGWNVIHNWQSFLC